MKSIRNITKEVRRVRSGNLSLRAEDNLRILATNERRGFRLPVLHGNNEYFLSRNAAWAGYAIPNKPWGFLDESDRANYFRSATNIFAGVFPAGKENSGHLIVTNRVYSADEWETALLERYADTAGPNFAGYVHASRNTIEQREFFERECYLMTRLGARGSNGSITGMIREVLESLALAGGMDDAQPSKTERAFWQQQAEGTTDTLSASWLTALPIHRRRLEWLIRHLDTPGLPTPDVAPFDAQEWESGDWRNVLASYTREVDLGTVGKDRLRCVEFDGPTGAGRTYAAYLPINHIPNAMHYGFNWLHHAASLQFPVDASLHFEIIDPERAERDLDKPITAAETQEEEDADAGVRPDDTTAMQQRGLRQVKTRVQYGRQVLAYWQCVLAVYDTDKTELLSKVNRLIRHYKDIHFRLECPRNDQRELFYQSMPGSEILVNDWIHRTDEKYLAAAQPWLTSSVGDRDDAHGLYQGHTITTDAQGNPQKGVPVFYDLQNVVEEGGRAPTEAVVGWPGSGKTVSRGAKVALEDALRGVTQFIWDPKGDFLPLKRYARPMQLDDSKVKLVDLYDPNNSVSLDAFAIAEVDPKRGIDERSTSALDVLNALCRKFVNDPGTGLDYQSILQQAVSMVMAEEKSSGVEPSMRRVVEHIRRWRQSNFSGVEDLREEKKGVWIDCARMLDQHLTQIETSIVGRLLFRDPSATGGSMRIERGDMIIFVAIKMQTTGPGEEPTGSSTVADVVSGLMTDYIRSLLYILPDDVPKSVVFDEWHVIKRTSRAEALLDWLRRMGRSKTCMVKQMSQSAKDFTKGSLSTVWAGLAQNEEEAAASCDLLGIEATQANTRRLMSMGPGQFLFRDMLGRVAHVQVDIGDDWLLSKLNTQPKAKAAMLRELTGADDTTN